MYMTSIGFLPFSGLLHPNCASPSPQEPVSPPQQSLGRAEGGKLFFCFWDLVIFVGGVVNVFGGLCWGAAFICWMLRVLGSRRVEAAVRIGGLPPVLTGCALMVVQRPSVAMQLAKNMVHPQKD